MKYLEYIMVCACLLYINFVSASLIEKKNNEIYVSRVLYDGKRDKDSVENFLESLDEQSYKVLLHHKIQLIKEKKDKVSSEIDLVTVNYIDVGLHVIDNPESEIISHEFTALDQAWGMLLEKKRSLLKKEIQYRNELRHINQLTR